jgi:branched-subunit amino acid aminotransferase/4-amino-4-deoxychorismate lyase
LRRLLGTAGLLGLRLGATENQIAAAAGEVLHANGLTEARMRITLTPGSVKAEEAAPTTLVTAEPLSEYPRQWYEKGIAVVVSSFKQARGDPTFGYKTGCYLPRVLGRQEAAAKGAEEALWFTIDNRLAEACFNNVFLVLAGKASTPPRDTPVLPGIVREAVIELCGPLGIACDDQSPLTVREMLGADEMFLTGSTSGIRPVVRVERHAVGDGVPGPITKKIMAAYRELLEKECPKDSP